MSFTLTLITVAIMLAYAIPGFLLVKTKSIKEESIASFAVLLMYVCQPALAIYSFNQANYTKELFIQMLIFFAIVFALMLLFLLVFAFIFRNKADNVKYRIYIIASCFGNCAFFGIPVLEALLPDHPEAVVFSTVFFIAMNIIGWTLGCALIAKDKKYISVKKIVLNPAVLSLIIALPLFFFNVKLPTQIDNFITVLAKMTTPLCMLLIGMRLATMEIKPIFNDGMQYIICAVKQLIFPLCALAIVWFIPIDLYVKQTLYILCCCPIAAIVQTFAEMLGQGQKESVNMVLLSTLLSILTIPLMVLIPIS